MIEGKKMVTVYFELPKEKVMSTSKYFNNCCIFGNKCEFFTRKNKKSF